MSGYSVVSSCFEAVMVLLEQWRAAVGRFGYRIVATMTLKYSLIVLCNISLYDMWLCFNLKQSFSSGFAVSFCQWKLSSSLHQKDVYIHFFF